MILDTNALTATAERDLRLSKLSRGPERLAIPVIVLGEYRLGIAQARHRASYENWLREWIAAVNVLDIDEQTTHSYSAIGLELKKKSKPIPSNDLWIAALCRRHSLPLLSREQHFDFVSGLQRID